MIVVNTREFRDKLKAYFDKVDKGTDVVVQRGANKSYRITPVTDDDALMSKEAFFAQIDCALQEAKAGKGKSIKTEDELSAYLKSL